MGHHKKMTQTCYNPIVESGAARSTQPSQEPGKVDKAMKQVTQQLIHVSPMVQGLWADPRGVLLLHYGKELDSGVHIP
jgi:hypothetical protein